jgi:3'-phosphoadenosine 5'-phosphosulfate (PAPS) 3'-phosphatase
MKIFGIGLSKTGTSSLAHALQILGYRTKDYPGLSNYLPGDLATFDPGVLDTHDALTDTPVPSFYRELDARFPGARFILTVRDMDGWLYSCKKQFTPKHAANLSPAHHQLFTDLYGTTVFDADRFRQGYERFTQGVVDYFRDRPADLLLLNVSAGQGWELLCPFLGAATPALPFPKANVTRIRWMRIEDVVDVARKAASLVPQSRPSAGRQAAGHLLRARAVVERWVGNLQAGEAGSVEALRRSIDRLVRQRLAALGAEIPVLSPFNPEQEHAARGQLNHYWLVEPLDTGPAGSSAADTAALSIALIEDQRPIYGVVCCPASNTVFYAVKGKGAFKMVGDAPPVKLETGRRRADMAAASACRDVPPVGSVAYELCRVAEGSTPADIVLQGAGDWQLAAGDAVLRAVGLQIRSGGDTERGLSYHRPRETHDRLRVGPAD